MQSLNMFPENIHTLPKDIIWDSRQERGFYM